MNSQYLGYCCINLSIPSQFKTVTLKSIKKLTPIEAKRKLYSLLNHNLEQVCNIIDWNVEHNIKLYRLSSVLFPLATIPEIRPYWTEILKSKIVWEKIQTKISNTLKNGSRYSIHPGQYCVISSESDRVNANGIMDLIYHGEFLDILGLPSSYETPINIHVSNGKNIQLAELMTKHNLRLLPKSVLSRLVFENEDKGNWTVENLLKANFNLPITFDFHHHLINSGSLSENDAFSQCQSTWAPNLQMCHYSEGKTGKLDRSHHDYVTSIPSYNCWLEVEAKAKDKAILSFIQKSS